MRDFEAQPDWNCLARAEALIEIERWREAIHELHKLLEFAPENYRALCLMAQCFYQLGEHNEGLSWSNRAIAVLPNNEWAHRLQACIYRKQGRKKQALKAANEAVRISPNEPFALHILACSQIDWNLIAEAEKNALHLREIAPESRYGHSALGHIAMNRKKFAEAETHFRRVLEIDPLSWDAMNNLGWVVLKQSQQGFNFSLRKERRKEAIECFRRAVHLNPTEQLSKTNLKAAERSSYIFGDFNFNGNRFWLVLMTIMLLRFVPLLFAGLDSVFQAVSPPKLLLSIIILLGAIAIVYKLFVRRRKESGR